MIKSMSQETVVLAPNGQLGYGVPEESINKALSNYDVDVIAIDAGSVDQGPFYLGQGESHTNDAIIRRDLELVLQAAEKADAPLLIGTLASAGSQIHLDNAAETAAEVIASENLDLSVARIYSDVHPDTVKEHIESGDIRTIGYDHELTCDDVDNAERIVGQIGPELYIKALEDGADVVLAGRSLDTSPFAAVPLAEQKDPGLVYHFSKIMECGSQATSSGSGNDALLGFIDDEYFEIEPPNPDLRCTVESVAAHTLYEKSDPYTIATTYGDAIVSNADFEQVSEQRVKVSGSVFEESECPTIKIEGVEKTGYRTISIGGIQDPTLIANLGLVLNRVEETVNKKTSISDDDYLLQFRQYGGNGVSLTHPDVQGCPNEIGLVIDVVSKDQESSDTICALARATLLHQDFDERVAIGGNLAFPYSPSDISVGPVYQFTIYHVVENMSSTDFAEIEWGVMP